MWYQLQIEQCHRNDVEALSEALEETGALSITLTDKFDDPVLEPLPGTTPLWPHIVVNALFSTEESAALALQELSHEYPQLQFCIQTLPDKDWERAWMDDFKPQRFGTRLWICPSWLTPPDPEAVNLTLDPGLAFGTGMHPTTNLCLTWLESFDLKAKSIIDYGCGSGILAIAALKLGAQSAVAVDIDPQALQATQSNATLNNISRAQLTSGLPATLTKPVDLIIANILLTPLIALQDNFHALLTNNGLLVVSGILTEQAPSLIESYKNHFIHQQTYELEGWSLLVFWRNPHAFV